MSDDRWRDSYDAWKLRSPYDDDPAEEPEEDDRSELEIAFERLREELSSAKSFIAELQRDYAAAVKWARDYETAHGPFKSEPRMPDFMVVF